LLNSITYSKIYMMVVIFYYILKKSIYIRVRFFFMKKDIVLWFCWKI